MFKFKTIIFTMLIVGLTFLVSQSVLAIGLISNPIEVESALRNESFQEILKIFNSEDAETVYKLKTEGDIEGWAKFYEEDDLETPITQILAPAKSYYDVIVIFTVPEDAANGESNGQLTIVLSPNEIEGEGSQASVRQSLSRDVYIKVTDEENIVLEVSVIPHSYDLKKGENLNVRLIYDNQGNVSLKPQIQFKIKQNDKNIYNAIFPYPEGIEAAKPGAQHEVPALEIPTSNLKDGQYTAEIEFLHNNQIILTKDFRFNIGSHGSILGAFNINYKIFWPIIGVVAVIVFIAIILFTLKKVKVSSTKR